jgi:hypothetical protein
MKNYAKMGQNAISKVYIKNERFLYTIEASEPPAAAAFRHSIVVGIFAVLAYISVIPCYPTV